MRDAAGGRETAHPSSPKMAAVDPSESLQLARSATPGVFMAPPSQAVEVNVLGGKTLRFMTEDAGRTGDVL